MLELLSPFFSRKKNSPRKADKAEESEFWRERALAAERRLALTEEQLERCVIFSRTCHLLNLLRNSRSGEVAVTGSSDSSDSVMRTPVRTQLPYPF